MHIRIIGAMSTDTHGVGMNNTIPWKQKADMNKFRQSTTEDGVIILGSKTFASFGERLLPHRIHIVLTSKKVVSDTKNLLYAATMDQAIQMAKKCVADGDAKGISIIGGTRVWEEGFLYADRLSLSYIHTDASVVFDTFFPHIDMSIWKEVSREDYFADDANDFDYSFVEYQKMDMEEAR